MVADQPGNLPAFGGSKESSKRHPENTPLRGTCGHFILPFVGHFIVGVTISHKMAGQFMLPHSGGAGRRQMPALPATVLVRSEKGVINSFGLSQTRPFLLEKWPMIQSSGFRTCVST